MSEYRTVKYDESGVRELYDGDVSFSAFVVMSESWKNTAVEKRERTLIIVWRGTTIASRIMGGKALDIYDKAVKAENEKALRSVR